MDERRWWWVTPEVIAFFAFAKDVILFLAGLTLFILETRKQHPQELLIIAEFGLMGLGFAFASDRRKRQAGKDDDDA